MQDIRLIEPVPIEDELCTGLATIEDVEGIGGRLVFYAKQTCYEAGTQVPVVKRKIVLTEAAIEQASRMLGDFALALGLLRSERLLRSQQGAPIAETPAPTPPPRGRRPQLVPSSPGPQ